VGVVGVAGVVGLFCGRGGGRAPMALQIAGAGDVDGDIDVKIKRDDMKGACFGPKYEN
jgi:hypothetical protein